MHRETLEETGLEVKIERLLGIYSDPKERTVTYLDNGDVAQLIDIVFIAKKQTGELKVSAESEELKFFDSQHLPEDLIPPVFAPLADYLKHVELVIQ